VGPGRTTNTGTLLPTGISVGDVVLFNRRAAQKIEVDDEEYLVFLSEHILGIFTE
jgi:chaperonin GroES